MGHFWHYNDWWGTDKKLWLINFQDILFTFSAQHDCQLCKCPTTATQHIRQDWQMTDLTLHLVAHSEQKLYLVNMYALHNAVLLCEALPRDLIAPRPLHSDWKEFHYSLAQKVRELQRGRREAASEKWKAAQAKRTQAVNQNPRKWLRVNDESEMEIESEEE